MTIYVIPFVISGQIEIEADNVGEALAIAAEYTNETLLDLANSITVDIGTTENIHDQR